MKKLLGRQKFSAMENDSEDDSLVAQSTTPMRSNSAGIPSQAPPLIVHESGKKKDRNDSKSEPKESKFEHKRDSKAELKAEIKKDNRSRRTTAESYSSYSLLQTPTTAHQHPQSQQQHDKPEKHGFSFAKLFFGNPKPHAAERTSSAPEDIVVHEDFRVFGVDLEKVSEAPKRLTHHCLPFVIWKAIDFIETNDGLDFEGIFRISSQTSKLLDAKQAFDKGMEFEMEMQSFVDGDIEKACFLCANIIKMYIRELPQNILTEKLKPDFQAAANIHSETERVVRIKSLAEKLPECNSTLLSTIILHLNNVAQHEANNKMSRDNLMLLMCTTLQIDPQLMLTFSANISTIFPNAKILPFPLQSEIIAKRAEILKQSSDLPTIVTTINDVNTTIIPSDLKTANISNDLNNNDKADDNNDETVIFSIPVDENDRISREIAFLENQLDYYREEMIAFGVNFPLKKLDEMMSIQRAMTELKRHQRINDKTVNVSHHSGSSSHPPAPSHHTQADNESNSSYIESLEAELLVIEERIENHMKAMSNLAPNQKYEQIEQLLDDQTHKTEIKRKLRKAKTGLDVNTLKSDQNVLPVLNSLYSELLLQNATLTAVNNKLTSDIKAETEKITELRKLLASRETLPLAETQNQPASEVKLNELQTVTAESTILHAKLNSLVEAISNERSVCARLHAKVLADASLASLCSQRYMQYLDAEFTVNVQQQQQQQQQELQSFATFE